MFTLGSNIILETQDLLLRSVVMGDTPSLFRIISNVEVNYYMCGSEHLALDDTLAWIRNLDTSDYNLVIVEKATGVVIGYVSLSQTGEFYEWELGMCIHPNCWNRGYGLQTVQAMIQWGYRVPDIRSIIAIVAKQNVPSIRLVVKCGFTCVEETQYSKYDGSKVFPAWKFKYLLQ